MPGHVLIDTDTGSDNIRRNSINWKKLPKVELHLHLDCSLSYDVVSEINPSITLNDYRTYFVAPSKCENLMDFLSRVPNSLALIQTKKQLHQVTVDLFRQLKAENVLYAEIRFAPLLHTEKGLSSYDVVAAVEKAATQCSQNTGVQARLILCTLRHFTSAQSIETVKLVNEFHGSAVTGFDIASDENLPMEPHIPAFQYAYENGIPCTAHAGEARGPKSVWEILQQLKPSRLGHGVRSIEDTALVDHLRQNHIHLEVCPTSNIQTNVYPTYADHPISNLYKNGVALSVNTDTRGIGNVTLTKEYARISQAFGWTEDDFYNCNKYALEAAFLPDDVRDDLLRLLADGYQDVA